MSGIALKDQLLWDHLQAKHQFTEKYSQLLINSTNPNKFHGELTPLSFALKQKNILAARLMLNSPQFSAQNNQLKAIFQAMIVALNSDSDEVKKIGEELLLQYGHLNDDAFTIGDKRYTPLSYVIQYKRESFNMFFQKQIVFIHTLFMAVDKALEIGELSIAKNILTVFKNDPNNKIYSSASPLSDPKTSYGKYDPEWIKLFIENGADATLLLFEAIKRSDQWLIIFLVGKGVSLEEKVFVEEKQKIMTISAYLVREKPQMIDTVLEGIKYAPKARLATAVFEAINSQQFALARKILNAFLNHPAPTVEKSSDNLLLLKFAIEVDENEIADALLAKVPDTGRYIQDSDDTLFSYVIRNYPHWIERIFANEKKILAIRDAHNIKTRKISEFPFKENMLFALRAAFEVNRIDLFEEILKLRDGLNQHAMASLSASCSRHQYVNLLGLVEASHEPRYKQLLLAYGAQLNPPITPIEKARTPTNNEFNILVTDAYIEQQYETFINLLRNKPQDYRLDRYLIKVLEIQHVGLQMALLDLASSQDLYRNIEDLLIAALNNNINFIIELVRRGLDIHYVMDVATGDTSVLGFLIQNEQYKLAENIISISSYWGRRSYFAVSAAIIKNKIDIASKILKKCPAEVTLLGATNLKDPIHDAAAEAAKGGHFPLVVALVARGASIDLSIIVKNMIDGDLEIILTALKTKIIGPDKAVEAAIRQNRNNALVMMLNHPIVNQQLQNQNIALSLLSTAILQDNLAAAQLILDKFKHLICFNDKVMELLLFCAKGQQPEHETIALQFLHLRKILIAFPESNVLHIDLCTIDDKTALEMSAATGKIKLVNELIKHHHADPHLQRTLQQHTAFRLAMTNGHENVAQLITTHTADCLNAVLVKRPYNEENLPSYNARTVHATENPETGHVTTYNNSF